MLKKFKLFAGITLFVKALMLVTVIIILSVQKKSIPKAIFIVLAATSLTSAFLLICYRRDAAKMRKLREMDSFYDYDYELAYDGIDDDKNDLGFEDGDKLITEIDD
jgi:general stress protein CsbA